ncbi:MAG: hypothetical protein ACYCO3_08840 [Mycobacteriales bacterium]
MTSDAVETVQPTPDADPPTPPLRAGVAVRAAAVQKSSSLATLKRLNLRALYRLLVDQDQLAHGPSGYPPIAGQITGRVLRT